MKRLLIRRGCGGQHLCAGDFMARKAQAWYLDLVGGMLIFIIGIVAYHHANVNLSGEDAERYGGLLSEADSIAAMLMTPGYPEDWSDATVEQIGVVSSHRLDAGKWLNFSGIPYNRSKVLLGARHEFFAFVEEKNGSAANISGVCGVGNPLVSQATQGCLPANMQGTAYSDLARRDRYALHDGRVVKMVVYIWR